MNSHQDPNDPSDTPPIDPPHTHPHEPVESPTADGQDPTPPPRPAPSAPTATSPNFFNWIRGLGVARGQDRWIGGVASGIAARTGFDPVLVRGGFVLLAIFGGIGILLYGLAWALLPEPDGRIHLESATRGSWTSGMTGALILTLVGIGRPNSPFFVDDGSGAFFWTIFWVGAVVFGIYAVVSRSNKKPATSPLAGEMYSAASDTQGTLRAPGALSPPPLYSQLPPIPEPALDRPKPGKPPIPKPTGAELALFAGGALIAVGAVLVLDYTGIFNLGNSVIPVAIGAGLILLGLGIVTLGMRGITSGFLGFLVAVGIVVAVVAGSTVTTGTLAVGSDAGWTATSADAASEGYTVAAGQATLDLRNLTDLDEDLVVPVNSVAGNLGILIPDDVPVQVRSSTALGSLNTVDNGQEESAGGLWQPAEINLNENATGPSIILEIRSAMSNTTVATTQTELENVGGISR
ncbi:PspC domain-containing protein [Arthrobacter sp. H20]|uniref:PspC domain-containing protein n=1 Tax=Arthrobacter sp. H20 TaxID=1267981 RepID=UPI00047BE095|nr:PspC domain-containing protein [Arthrobacter sp. H20]